MSKLEEQLYFQMRTYKLELPLREYRFGAMAAGGTGKGLRDRLAKAGLKDWRFDFAWPNLKLAVEVEGGIFVGGRHNRGKGFENDLEKYDRAMSLGWNIYRCSDRLIKEGRAVRTINQLIEIHERNSMAIGC